MDLTSLYRSRLESIKKLQKDIPPEFQNNAKSSNNNNNSSPTSMGIKSKLFPGKKSEYYLKARELCSTISSLRDFLVDNRSAYLHFGSGPRSHGSSSFSSSSTSSSVWRNSAKDVTFSDIERDQIDSDVQKIIQNCQKKIFEYDRLIEMSDIVQSCPQLHTHLENVHNSLADYLKDVCTIHSEMRAVRVKRTVDYQTMSRLASHTQRSHHSSTTRNSTSANNNSAVNSPSSSSSSLSSAVTSPSSKNISSSLIDYDQTDSHQQHGVSSSSTSNVPAYFDDELSPEELQMFEAENVQLLNELNTLADEVNQIETSVVRIANLQEIFTEKVLQQDKQMGTIANTVVGATENIRGGNEQIRQAIQKNADFRAWVLFFIIVMSFSLLFLDWYND